MSPYLSSLWVRMGNYVTVSVKVPKEVKEKMEKLGVKWGSILRQAIGQEIQKAERAKAVDAILELSQKAPKTENGTAVRLVREIREGIGEEDND